MQPPILAASLGRWSHRRMGDLATKRVAIGVVALALASGWACAVGCGGRSGLFPVDGAGGSTTFGSGGSSSGSGSSGVSGSTGNSSSSSGSGSSSSSGSASGGSESSWGTGGSSHGSSGGGTSADCLPPPSGIVSWWTGDDTFADVEGRNPGTADGTITFATGKVGSAFVLDGASSVVAATNDFPVGSADRTIEFWAYLSSSFGGPSPDGGAAVQEMFAEYGEDGTAGGTFEVFTWGTPAINWSQWGGDFSGGSMSIGVWTHVAATSTAGTITLFQNGVQVASQALFPYNTPAETMIHIGGVGLAPEGVDHHLTGMMDEVTVYNRALTPAEIASISAAGSAGKCH